MSLVANRARQEAASELAQLIEKQCDDFATGTQDRQFLRNDDNSEPLMREMLRLNLEQFATRLLQRT